MSASVWPRVRDVFALVAVVACLLALGSQASIRPTRAAWNDTAILTTTQGAATAAGMPAIGAIACQQAGDKLSITLSWADASPLYEYVVEAFTAGGTRYFFTTVNGTAGSVSVTIPNTTNVRFLQEVYRHSVTITPQVRNNTTWVGTTVTRSFWEQLRYVTPNPYVHCTDPS